jgi:hypothetical protein
MLGQEDNEFETSVDYTERTCFEKKTKSNNQAILYHHILTFIAIFYHNFLKLFIYRDSVILTAF